MQGLRVQSLVEELRSHILHEAAKTNKQQQQKKSVTLSLHNIVMMSCLHMDV